MSYNLKAASSYFGHVFVLKLAIAFHFPTINMHRTANEAEPTKIIRF